MLFLTLMTIVILITLTGAIIYGIASNEEFIKSFKRLLKFPLNCFLDLILYLLRKRCEERGI